MEKQLRKKMEINAEENFLQGGYQMCSDTMLRNMAFMEK
jgi:hypothetical protein